ncbi:MAG: cyclase family protein [Lentisphaerae bacterium]|nr:cyclase family protein [Lentisphaerota bacterium]
MSELVDLTWDFIGERYAPDIRREETALQSGLTAYTGVTYNMNHDGMSGTYIDFPGHIAQTDNGLYADNCPLDMLYRVPASVIRLAKRSGEGAVNADELEQAFGGKVTTPALIINALADAMEPSDIDRRSVYLDNSAIQWIIDSRCKLLVSDIYESKALHGVFPKLFGAGVSTVCMPVNLHKLPVGTVRLTTLFAKMPQVTQLPCRVVAEF